MVDLLVVGTVAFDDIETPHGTVKDALGGSATYFSYAASFFTKVALVGAVGEDFPEEHLDLLRSRDIDMEGLRRIEGKKTFHWSGKYVGDMNSAETLDTKLNVLENYKPAVPDDHQKTPFVFLANGEPTLQLSVLDQVKSPKFLVCDTMNLWIDTALDSLMEVFQRVDGVIINDGEAKMLTGENNIVAAGRRVAEMGPATVVIKRGEFGSCLFSPEGYFAIPAFPVSAVVDPTGAGDSFAGGVMGYLASGGVADFAGLKKAMAYGTVVSSFNVEGFSLESFKRISRGDIESRYLKLVEYTSH